MPSWALTLAYTRHMAAPVAWIGGLFFQSVFLGPALRRTLDPPSALRLLELLRRRFDPLAWLSLAVLIATGLTQMNASPSYEGFLALQNPWAVAILAKHGLIALMVALAGYQTLFLYPWLGVLFLSFGFCGVFGTLLRRARHGSGSARAQVALFGALVILPSAAMVLGLPGFALPARFAIVLGGALGVAAAGMAGAASLAAAQRPA